MVANKILVKVAVARLIGGKMKKVVVNWSRMQWTIIVALGVITAVVLISTTNARNVRGEADWLREKGIELSDELHEQFADAVFHEDGTLTLTFKSKVKGLLVQSTLSHGLVSVMDPITLPNLDGSFTIQVGTGEEINFTGDTLVSQFGADYNVSISAVY